jgi:septum formation protein
MKKDFVYLASGSPRRAELLRQIGVPFEVWPASIEQTLVEGEAVEEYARRLATTKADKIWEEVEDDGLEPRPVLAADTAVVVDGRVLGKPQNAAEAEAMLEELSGRTHRVLTAVALRCGKKTDSLVASSEVRFRATTAAERRAYCATDEPYDKAGGYGIQGLAAVFVEHLNGSYSAVVGLPLYETALLLERCGVAPWQAPKPVE